MYEHRIPFYLINDTLKTLISSHCTSLYHYIYVTRKMRDYNKYYIVYQFQCWSGIYPCRRHFIRSKRKSAQNDHSRQQALKLHYCETLDNYIFSEHESVLVVCFASTLFLHINVDFMMDICT